MEVYDDCLYLTIERNQLSRDQSCDQSCDQSHDRSHTDLSVQQSSNRLVSQTSTSSELDITSELQVNIIFKYMYKNIYKIYTLNIFLQSVPSSTDPTPPHTCETNTSSSSTLRVTSNGVLPAVPETDSINTVTSEAPCHYCSFIIIFVFSVTTCMHYVLSPFI